MTSLRRAVLLAIAAVVVGLPASAAAAPTAVTIGQLPPSASGGSCFLGQVDLQLTSTGGPSYVVPAGPWVVVSWSTAPFGTGGTERLVVARPLSALTSTAVGVSDAATFASGSTPVSFPARIPVQGGDLLGLNPLSGSFQCTFAGAAGDLVRTVAGNHVAGETMTAGSGTASIRLNVQARLEPDADQDGYGDVSQDGCATDAASQGACTAPTISGTAQVGETLTVAVGGAPVSPTLQWLRCDAAGGACVAVPGAGGATFVLTGADAGSTLRVRQTATSASATDTTDSAATSTVTAAVVVPPPPPVAPRLGPVHQSARTWATRKGRHHRVVGTKLTFTLDAPASVRIDLSRLLGGRTVKGRCVAETKANRTKRSCTRSVAAGSVKVSGRAGADTVFFAGRTDTGRTLSPGHYRATVTAVGAGGLKSAAQTLKFTVATP